MIDEVGPFQWARWYNDGTPGDPPTISVAGVQENVELLSGDDESGALRFTGWSGINQDSSFNLIAGASILGKPFEYFWIGFDSFLHEQSTAAGSYTDWVPRGNQWAHLRIGYYDIPWELMQPFMQHGPPNPPPFFSAVPVANKIFANISFGHPFGSPPSPTSGTYQNSFFSGNPEGSGIWQSPAGGSPFGAQLNVNNRLATLGSVLTGNPNSNGFRYDFRTRAGGHWTLFIDTNGDGEADIAVDSLDAGNKPADFEVCPISGLACGFKSWASAGGTTSGRSIWDLNYARSSAVQDTVSIVNGLPQIVRYGFFNPCTQVVNEVVLPPYEDMILPGISLGDLTDQTWNIIERSRGLARVEIARDNPGRRRAIRRRNGS